MVRAQVKVVTGDTSFTPDGLDPVSVPPGSTAPVPLTAELGKALRDGALGVAVEADAADHRLAAHQPPEGPGR